MSGLHPLKKTAMQGLGMMLAATILLAGAPLAMGQVGPEPPRAKPTRESNVSKAITKLFKKEEEKPDAKAGAADADAKAETKTAKPVVKPHEHAEHPERIQPPKRPPMLSQPPLTNAKIEQPEVDSENPPVVSHPRLDDPTNPLGFSDAEARLKKLIAAVEAQRFSEARPGVIQLRQWLVDLTEAHIGLYKTLNQIPSARAQAELEKELALQFAQLRDRTMLEMAKIYIHEKDYGKAVKELTEVVKSQPRSKIGLRSYELLQEIGFTEKLQLAQ